MLKMASVLTLNNLIMFLGTVSGIFAEMRCDCLIFDYEHNPRIKEPYRKYDLLSSNNTVQEK